MLSLVPKRLVTKLTGLAFALAIVAALGVGVFSPGAAQHAQAGPPQFEQTAPEVVEWSTSSTWTTCTIHSSWLGLGSYTYGTGAFSTICR